MLTNFLTKTMQVPKANMSMFRAFSSKIKTNRKFGEDAPPKDRGLDNGSIHEKRGQFPRGDLPYSQM